MKATRVIFIAAIAFCGISCATLSLWDATNPNEFVEVLDSSITTTDLNSNKIAYRVDENTGRIFIKKSSLRKLGDYTIRTLATPFTIVIDAATALTVVAVLSTKSDWDNEVKNNPDNPQPILIYPSDPESNW